MHHDMTVAGVSNFMCALYLDKQCNVPRDYQQTSTVTLSTVVVIKLSVPSS